MFKSLVFNIIVLLTLLSCDKPSLEVKKEELTVNKEEFLKKLGVAGRMWRFEKLHIKYPDSEITIDFRNVGEIRTLDYVLDGPIRNNSLQFWQVPEKENDLHETISTGPSGDYPYPYNRDMYSSPYGLTTDGSWKWDDDKSTVMIFPPASIASIIYAASEKRFRPTKVYLDNTMPPAYGSLSDALQAGKAERIRVIAEEKDPAIGKVTYMLYLRGAWIRETKPYGKETIYKATY